MKARQLFTAALLTVSATMAMSQELDPSETLQAKSLAAQAAAKSDRSRAAVVAELRNAQAAGEMKAVGEKAEAPVSSSVIVTVGERQKTRAEVRAELASWNETHKQVVGEFNGEPADPPVGGQVAAAPLTRAQVKAELAEWRRTHALVVGDRN